MEKIAEGFGNLRDMADYEPLIAEGEGVEVRCYFDRPVDPNIADRVHNELLATGLQVDSVDTIAQCLRVRCRKAVGPLLVVAVVVGTVTAMISAVVGWQIFRTTQAGLPLWVWVIGGGAVLYLVLRKPMRAAGAMAKDVGRRTLDVGEEYAKQRVSAPRLLPPPKAAEEA